MHTIHNVNYSAQVYASTNADLGAYAHRNIIAIYGNFQEIHSKCILLASADVRFSGIAFQYSSQHVHNVSHTAQVYNALYSYCGGCAGFQSKDVQSTQSIYM